MSTVHAYLLDRVPFSAAQSGAVRNHARRCNGRRGENGGLRGSGACDGRAGVLTTYGTASMSTRETTMRRTLEKRPLTRRANADDLGGEQALAVQPWIDAQQLRGGIHPFAADDARAGIARLHRVRRARRGGQADILPGNEVGAIRGQAIDADDLSRGDALALRDGVAVVAGLHRVLLTAWTCHGRVGDNGRERREGRVWDGGVIVGPTLLLDRCPLVCKGGVVAGVLGALQAEEEICYAVGADDIPGKGRAVRVLIGHEAGEEVCHVSVVGLDTRSIHENAPEQYSPVLVSFKQV